MDGKGKANERVKRRLEFLLFEERFRKAPFRNGLVWTVRLTYELFPERFDCSVNGKHFSNAFSE